ncbi:MAG: hypothetical protein AAGD43_03375 [Pseudomonadota bacterium]
MADQLQQIPRRPPELRQGPPQSLGQQVYEYVLNLTQNRAAAEQLGRVADGIQMVNPLPQAYEAGQNMAGGILDGNPAQFAYGAGMGAMAAVPGMAVGSRAAGQAARAAGDVLPDMMNVAGQQVPRTVAKADEAFAQTGQIPSNVAMDMQRQMGQLDDYGNMIDRGMRLPMGGQTAAAAGLGAGTAVAGDMAFQEFDPGNYEDWLRSIGMAATGAVGGAAGERLGASMGRPSKSHSKQTRPVRRERRTHLAPDQNYRSGKVQYYDQETVPGVSPGEASAATAMASDARAMIEPRLARRQKGLGKMPPKPKPAARGILDEPPTPDSGQRPLTGRSQRESDGTVPGGILGDPPRNPVSTGSPRPDAGQGSAETGRSPRRDQQGQKKTFLTSSQRKNIRDRYLKHVEQNGPNSKPTPSDLTEGMTAKSLTKANVQEYIDELDEALTKGAGGDITLFRSMSPYMRALAPVGVATGAAATGILDEP